MTTAATRVTRRSTKSPDRRVSSNSVPQVLVLCWQAICAGAPDANIRVLIVFDGVDINSLFA